MKKLIKNKHFVSALGFAILCTSVFLLFSSFSASRAQTDTSTTSENTIIETEIIPKITISPIIYKFYEPITFIASINVSPVAFKFIIYDNLTKEIKFEKPFTHITNNQFELLWPTLPYGEYSIRAVATLASGVEPKKDLNVVYAQKLITAPLPIQTDPSPILEPTTTTTPPIEEPSNTNLDEHGDLEIIPVDTENTETNQPPLETEPIQNTETELTQDSEATTATPVTNNNPVPETPSPTPVVTPNIYRATNDNTNTPIVPKPKPATITPPTQTNTTIQNSQNLPNTSLPSNTRMTPIATPPSQIKTIDQACKDLNINDYLACQNYLSLPKICKQNNILSRAQCNTFLDLPFRCQEKNISNVSDCQNYIKSLSLPTICVEANISDQNACRELLQKNILPDICKNADISDFSACQDFISKESKPILNKDKCTSLGIVNDKLCQSYLEWSKINPECESILIFDEKECRDYLLNSFGAKTCKEVGITDKNDCESYIINTYTKTAECREINSWECASTLNKNLGTITSTQSKYDQLEKMEKTDNGSLEQKEIINKLGSFKNFLPLSDDNSKLKLVNTKKQIIISSGITQTSPLAVMIDSDQDGLSDDMEKRIGTDIYNIDSDNDTFSDYEEYKNGYNPLGPGKIIDFKPAPIDEAILSGKSIEHPKVIPTFDQSLEIAELDKEKKLLTGTANPGHVYTLFIYSDLPIITTVQTDEFGNWQYTFQESMIDGEHEVYLALNDNTGKVVSRSNPFDFFIKEARAVSVEDFVSTTAGENKNKSNSMLLIYIIASILSIIVGLSVFVAFIKHHKKIISNNEI